MHPEISYKLLRLLSAIYKSRSTILHISVKSLTPVGVLCSSCKEILFVNIFHEKTAPYNVLC